MKTLKNILRFILRWNEFYVILIPLFLIIMFPTIVMFFLPDYPYGGLPLSSIEDILHTILCVAVFQVMAWLFIRIAWDNVFNFKDRSFRDRFNKLNEWQQVKTLLVIFFAYLFALVLTHRIISGLV